MSLANLSIYRRERQGETSGVMTGIPLGMDATGKMEGTLTATCASNRLIPDYEGILRLVAAGSPAFQGSRIVTNLFLQSGTPATQTMTLGVGTYLCTVTGSGSYTSSAGTATASGYGAATASATNTVIVTIAGTVVYTLTGSLTTIQLENISGQSIATSGEYVPTTTVPVTRCFDYISQTIFPETLIGTPGGLGFGVGIAPELPTGFSEMTGTNDPSSDNYGNYTFSDGSVMVWVPRFYYRVGHASNPTYGTYGVNSVDIKGMDTYPTTSSANAAGYALHRMFIDGGIERLGCFVDKYKVSKQALGTGFVASSIKNGDPISTGASHNLIGDLTAVSGTNAYYSAITAAKARDGINGAVNASSLFFCTTRFITAGLALLSLAHGQASSAVTYCAWYSAGSTNFPKGCNTNALKDCNDTAVTYQSDAFSNCGKTGSAGYGGGAGNTFAKTTHNGQNCGIADLNGLMYEINPGLTCITSTKTITSITQSNPAVVTSAAHGLTNGQQILITDVVGMTQANTCIHTVANVTANTFELSGVNSTGYTAYTSGGTITLGTFYVFKNAAAVKTLTAGNTLATDIWGATGVAAHSDVITVPMANGACAMYFGNAANQVLDGAMSGDAWKLAGLGLPKDANGVSAGGSSLFGNDYFYEYFINDLVPLSCMYWANTTYAGVWGVSLYYARASASYGVGFRCACYGGDF